MDNLMQLLEVAIGTVLVFAIFSGLATAANEAIAAFFDTRAKFLKDGITELFNPTPPGVTPRANFFAMLTNVLNNFSKLINLFLCFFSRQKNLDESAKVKELDWVDKFYTHPLISVMWRDSGMGGKQPSYIPPAAALTAFLDCSRDAGNRVAWTVDGVREALQAIPASLPIRAILDDIWHKAQGDLDEFSKSFDGWYKEFGNQISSWYRQKTQFMLFFLSLTIAFAMNVDAIAIFKQLSRDKEVRTKLIDYAKEQSTPKTQNGATPPKDPADLNNKAKPKIDVGSNNDKGSDSKTNPKAGSPDPKDFDETLKTLHLSGLAFGWDTYKTPQCLPISNWLNRVKNRILNSSAETPAISSPKCALKDYVSLIEKFLGILLTAAAMTLGAPFWFDILNKLFEIRSVGASLKETLAKATAAEEKKDEAKSKQ